MATTGFWPVKGNLQDVIKYAENPDKTSLQKCDKDLASTLDYATNNEKTDMQLYVSGINCTVKKAYQQMMATKHRYGKTGGNVAYHGYQSFRTGEVTPDEAHKIGIETARRMWGDNYEIVITTHLNTENLHNHFVINSVSYKTGEKFQNYISDHIKLREISDRVCEEHNKSVLKNARFYKSGKKEYWIHKNGGLTHRDMLRQDVDTAIKQSASLLEFSRIMENMGYRFNRSIGCEHPSVILKSWERPIRIDSLGINYTKEAIIRRTAENGYIIHSLGKNERTQKPTHTPLKEIEYQMSRVKYMGNLEAMFYLIMELLKPMQNHAPNYTPPLSPSLRQELTKFNKYKKQFKLLCDEHIHTTEELELFIRKTGSKISDLEEERSKTDNKRRRADTDEDKEQYKALRRDISAILKPLREKLRLAKEIKKNAVNMQMALSAERELENKITYKERKKQR